MIMTTHGSSYYSPMESFDITFFYTLTYDCIPFATFLLQTKPLRLRFRCKNRDLELNAQPDDSGLLDSTSKDLIWY